MAVVAFDSARQASLVTRGQAGDKTALGQLYDETFPVVYRWALAATRNREDAEDITAETFVRALKSLHRYESREVPIGAWLVRIAQNVLHEQRNKQATWRVVDIAAYEVHRLAAEERTPQVEAELKELLGELTPAQREVLTLRLAGLKVREIAVIQGRAEGTVKALQFTAVRNLRGSRATGVAGSKGRRDTERHVGAPAEPLGNFP